MSTLDDLLPHLEMAVPCYMAELVAAPPAEREARARGWQADAARSISHLGDLLQFRAGTEWEPRRAAAYEHLARGLAALAVLGLPAPPIAGRTWTPPPRSCWATEPTPAPRRPTITTLHIPGTAL